MLKVVNGIRKWAEANTQWSADSKKNFSASEVWAPWPLPYSTFRFTTIDWFFFRIVIDFLGSNIKPSGYVELNTELISSGSNCHRIDRNETETLAAKRCFCSYYEKWKLFAAGCTCTSFRFVCVRVSGNVNRINNHVGMKNYTFPYVCFTFVHGRH